MYRITTNAIDGFKQGVTGRMKSKGYYKATGTTVASALNSNNLELFSDCVYQAYLDAKRKFNGINTITPQQKQDCFNYLGKELFDFFDSTPLINEIDFDNWHKDVCAGFINEFRKYGYSKVTVGMAQKVVNLSFKYLYCCNGASTFSNHFKFCHLTLDDYILAWYTRVVNTSNKISEWSTLNDYSDYLNIQKSTRTYLPTSQWSPLCSTLLECEFYVFPDEFIVKSLIELRKAINSYSNASHSNSEIMSLFLDPLDASSTDGIEDFIKKF